MTPVAYSSRLSHLASLHSFIRPQQLPDLHQFNSQPRLWILRGLSVGVDPALIIGARAMTTDTAQSFTVGVDRSHWFTSSKYSPLVLTETSITSFWLEIYARNRPSNAQCLTASSRNLYISNPPSYRGRRQGTTAVRRSDAAIFMQICLKF